MIKKVKQKKFLVDGEFLVSLIVDQDQHLDKSEEPFRSFTDVLKDSSGYLYNLSNLNSLNKAFREVRYINYGDDKKIEMPKPIYVSYINKMLSEGVEYEKFPKSYGNMIELDEISDEYKDFESLFYSHNNTEKSGKNKYNQDAVKLSDENFKLKISLKEALKEKFSSLLSKKRTKAASVYLPNELFDNLLQTSKNYYVYDMHLYGYDTKFGFNQGKKLNDEEFRILIKRLTFYTDWIQFVVQKENLPLPNVYFFGATNIKGKFINYKDIVEMKNLFIKKLIHFSDEMNHESINFFVKLINKKKIQFNFLSSFDKGKHLHGNAILNDYSMSSWDNRTGLFKSTYEEIKKNKPRYDNLFFDKKNESPIFKHETSVMQDFNFKSFFKRDHIYTKYLKRLNNVIDNNRTLYPTYDILCKDCKRHHKPCIHKAKNKNYETK